MINGAGLLAGFAALLSFAALAEALRGRFAAGEDLGPALLRGRRAAATGLRLGLPAKLARAGLEGRVSLGAVLVGKAGSTCLGVIGAVAAAPAAPGRFGVLVSLGLPACGFLGPDALLERRARRRHRALVTALPDALDLLAVSAASGRSAASGFAEIAAAGEGALARELGVVVAEMSCGSPAPLALAALRRRVPGPEVATLCASVERSRLLGVPLADQLRRQASALRVGQRRGLEERAARAAPKIQLVVALILVPSVLLMIVAGLVANSDQLLAGF